MLSLNHHPFCQPLYIIVSLLRSRHFPSHANPSSSQFPWSPFLFPSSLAYHTIEYSIKHTNPSALPFLISGPSAHNSIKDVPNFFVTIAPKHKSHVHRAASRCISSPTKSLHPRRRLLSNDGIRSTMLRIHTSIANPSNLIYQHPKSYLFALAHLERCLCALRQFNLVCHEFYLFRCQLSALTPRSSGLFSCFQSQPEKYAVLTCHSTQQSWIKYIRI